MANPNWRGGAAPVAQVVTLTVGGTVEVGDKFKITIGSKTLTVIAASTNVDTVATAIATAFNLLSSSVYPEFTGTARGMTAQAVGSGGQLTLTAKTAGVPFAVTLTTVETNDAAADAQTFTQSTTTANSGPNDWSTAANWDTGAVPVTGDNVNIANSSISILWGLDQSAVTLASLNIEFSYSGTIGLPNLAAAGFAEYLPTYLAISATVVSIGRGSGSGSGRIKLNTGSNATAITVTATGGAAETGVEAFLWKGAHATNQLTGISGTIGIAIFGGETATLPTLRSDGATIRAGSGATLTTVIQAGPGTVTLQSGATTVRKDPTATGTLRCLGTGGYTTIEHFGGLLDYQSSGTIGTLSGGDKGIIDFENNPIARNITNANFYKGYTLRDRSETVSFGNLFSTPGCTLADLHLNFGSGRSYQVSN